MLDFLDLPWTDGWLEHSSHSVDKWHFHTDQEVEPSEVLRHDPTLEVAGEFGYDFEPAQRRRAAGALHRRAVGDSSQHRTAAARRRTTPGPSDSRLSRASAVPTDTPRVLFLSPRREEYLADSVFHGLRSLLGDRAVDYPKHEIMYRSCPEESIRRARGHGFTLYGLLEDIEIDRSRTLDEIHWGEFDLVIFGAIHESFGQFVEIYPELERAEHARCRARRG